MPTEAPILKTPPRWPMIARALHARGDIPGALTAWRKAAVEAPDDAAAWTVVALMLADAGKLEAALLPAAAAAALRPDHGDSHARLGAVRALAGRKAEALQSFRRALALAPESAVARSRFGHVAIDAGETDLAHRHLNRALAVDATDGLAWAAVARRHFADFDFDRADVAFRRGLAMAPALPALLVGLAELRRDEAEIAVALRLYERAFAAEASARIERALLLALLYMPDLDEAAHFKRHLAYARRHAPERPRPPAEPVSGRRIRLGYLSAGFFEHPTAALTVRLIEAHDRRRFEILLFAHVARPDAMSRRLESAADRWVDVHGLSFEAIAERIRASRIDILVHPAGRHDPIIWPVAALRPAPVQVALYEAATTGIAAFDYLITDATLNPRRGTERTVERMVRLPSLPLHELPADAPEVAPLPALARGHVTFGSLNNSAKLNDRVLALWARVLASVPSSRLLIKAPLLASRQLAERVRAVFRNAGIAGERVELMPGYTNSRRELLGTYDRIDIGLDTFPYSGGMTTFEAMCQGVPVVTLAASRMVGRWGATLAAHAGHADLVAETEDAFVGIAGRLAADLPALAARRARLRGDFLSSPLCDARLKARHLERAYRRMVS
jgi:predicted O-linked N-acetylglucosamine transferase (SPINDLY family)